MITLTTLYGLPRTLSRVKPIKLISLLDPGWLPETPPSIKFWNHLKLGLSDIRIPIDGMVVPSEEHIERLLEFGSKWEPQERLVIHCGQARSRSPAALLILLIQKNPERESEIARAVRRRAHQIRPNPLMIEIGDRLLGCEGRLTEAVRSMSEPSLRDFQDRHVSFPVIWRGRS